MPGACKLYGLGEAWICVFPESMSFDLLSVTAPACSETSWTLVADGRVIEPREKGPTRVRCLGSGTLL